MIKTQRIVSLIGGMILLLAGCSNAQSSSPSSTTAVAPEPAAGIHEVTFVELGSVNCIPCKMMQPVMAEIEKEYAGKVNVVFYDVWTAAGEPYGKKYNIRAIPTQVFLDKNGKEFFRHMGFFPKEEIVKVLQKQGVTKE